MIVRSGVPHRTVDDLRNPALELHIGSIDTDVPHILKDALGLSYKIAYGYKGKDELDLAMERGEADGRRWAVIGRIRVMSIGSRTI